MLDVCNWRTSDRCLDAPTVRQEKPNIAQRYSSREKLRACPALAVLTAAGGVPSLRAITDNGSGRDGCGPRAWTSLYICHSHLAVPGRRA